MIESPEFRKGWQYASELQGTQLATNVGKQYIDSIVTEIDKLSNSINSYSGSKQSPAVLGGFIAEEWQAGTFNINAIAAESAHKAFVEKSTEQASVDVSTSFGTDYSLKYYYSSDASVRAQAKNVLQNYHEYLSSAKSRGTSTPMSFEEYLLKYGYSDDLPSLLTSVYNGQGRIIPADQLEEGIKKLQRMIASEAARDTENRILNMHNYEETLKNLSDRIRSSDGIESIPLSKKEAEAIAALCKDGKFKPEDFGITLDSTVTSQYILNQALKGGMTASVLTLAIQLVPCVVTLLHDLIAKGKINVDEIKRDGLKCTSSSIKSFILGFLSCGIYTSCRAGKVASSLVSINAPVIGTIVSFTMEIVNVCFSTALGKTSTEELRYTLTKDLIITCSSLIGGGIAVAILPMISGIAFALGSMIGSITASIITNIGEKVIISLCVNTGYSLFGIVKQDYELPVDILKQMGVNINEIERMKINYSNVNRSNIQRNAPSYNKVNRVKIVVLRRGVIAFHKIGYVQ